MHQNNVNVNLNNDNNKRLSWMTTNYNNYTPWFTSMVKHNYRDRNTDPFMGQAQIFDSINIFKGIPDLFDKKRQKYIWLMFEIPHTITSISF